MRLLQSNYGSNNSPHQPLLDAAFTAAALHRNLLSPCLHGIRPTITQPHTTQKITFLIKTIHLFGMDNVMLPCCSQELLPFLSVMYFLLPPFAANYSSILSHIILPSISQSASQSCCSQIHIKYPFGNFIFFHSLYMPKPT